MFKYLLLCNVKFPPSLPTFVGYFNIAAGDPNALGVAEYMPDINKWLIKPSDIEGKYDTEILPPAFVEAEISPYFIISYSGKLNTWILAVFIALPVLLLLSRIFKKVTAIENALGTFFFNGPLRTLTEMYFEMVITIFVNVGFIKFRNKSQIIGTATCFIFGVFAIMFPFIMMSIIYANRRFVRKRKFTVSYGMLTEEFSQKNIM